MTRPLRMLQGACVLGRQAGPRGDTWLVWNSGLRPLFRAFSALVAFPVPGSCPEVLPSQFKAEKGRCSAGNQQADQPLVPHGPRGERCPARDTPAPHGKQADGSPCHCLLASWVVAPKGFSSQTGPGLLQKQRNRVRARSEGC